MYAIETNNLTKRFDSLTAVNNVNLAVEKGLVFGLLGPNGAGKTTIIKMLSTLTAATEGSASVWGHSIATDRDAVRRCIGMVFQDSAIDDRLTATENLDFHARMYGMKKNVRRERMQEVLELVALEDKKDVLLKNYSGGMKRRLEIARGLMHYPHVLFLDEPTLGLDPQTRFHIWKYIKRLNEREKVTIILTTHYMEEADELCSRVGIIDFGSILVTDSPENLKNAMGNDLLSIKSPDPGGIAELLSREQWVNSVEHLNDALLVSARQGDEKVPLAVDIARSLGITITSISVRKPTLEDVFLHYTGKSIRDESGGDNSLPRSRAGRRGRGHR